MIKNKIRLFKSKVIRLFNINLGLFCKIILFYLIYYMTTPRSYQQSHT